MRQCNDPTVAEQAATVALEKPEKRIQGQLHVTFLPAMLFHVTNSKWRLFIAARVAVRVKKARCAAHGRASPGSAMGTGHQAAGLCG